MSTEADRRAQGATRIPFEALVEVGGAVGPAFEAQAVNISEEGMQLRTAYLPEAGQPITCRFDSGSGQSVLASGEVVWAQQAGKGGEFGIRFTDMNPESIESLRRMCGVSKDGPPVPPGTKVRLHIEGLASPMRARVRQGERGGVTVGSDLGFLQVGKDIELEDAKSGGKRPARIERVEVEVDQQSLVPQLVVSLRYDGGSSPELAPPAPREEDAPAEAREAGSAKEPQPGDHGDLEAMRRVPGDVKSAVTRGVAAIGPAFSSFTKRAKTTIALLAARPGAPGAPAEPAVRRTTAPAPGGGLHTSGRKVIRGETSMSQTDQTGAPPKFRMTKRKAAVAGGAIVAVALAFFALKKPAHNPPSASGAASADVVATSETHHHDAPAAAALATAPSPQPLPNGAMPNGTAMAPGALAAADPMASPGDKPDKKHGKIKVAPFGNGPVSHGTILHIKMDGAIEAIQGAPLPQGFTVKIPGRKPLEAASALASRDSRIAAIKVTSDAQGTAELTLTFKDGIPNYQVRAKKDTLEIALAAAGKGAVAKKQHGAHGAKKKHHANPDDN